MVLFILILMLNPYIIMAKLYLVLFMWLLTAFTSQEKSLALVLVRFREED